MGTKANLDSGEPPGRGGGGGDGEDGQLGDVLSGRLADIDIDSVEAVRDVRERG